MEKESDKGELFQSALDQMDVKKLSSQQIKAAEERRAKIKAQGLIEIFSDGDNQDMKPSSMQEAFAAKKKMFEMKRKGIQD